MHDEQHRELHSPVVQGTILCLRTGHRDLTHSFGAASGEESRLLLRSGKGIAGKFHQLLVHVLLQTLLPHFRLCVVVLFVWLAASQLQLRE